MNLFSNKSKSLTWLMALALAGVMAGCGGGGGGGNGGSSGGSGTFVPPAVLPGAGVNPTVGSASPANGATNVATSTNNPGDVVSGKTVTATFNQAMDPTTITPVGVFTLKETLSGTNVPGTVTMNAANTIATFTPTALALLPGIQYTATVSTAAKTAIAPGPTTAMPNPVSWSFTTNAVASNAQGPVDLGRAGTFAIFSNTAVTSVGPSDVQGNIGTAGTGAATTITCPEVTAGGSVFTVDATFPGAVCNTIDPAFVGLTAGDMAAAITDAKGRTIPDFVDLGVAGDISGLNLVPGLYKWNSGVLIDNTGITITGGADDVWIFQISGNLTVQDNAIITLAGAQAKNIFWQSSGGVSVPIGSAVQFAGIVMADFGITLTAGSTVNGRLLGNTAITLITNTVTPPAP